MNRCKRILAKLLIVTLLLSGCGASVLAQPSTPPTAELTLMSFNIRCLNGGDGGKTHWSQRKDAVCDYINQSEAHALCMQEVVREQSDDIMMNLSEDYGYVYYAREEGSNPEGLMTVFDVNTFELMHDEVFWLSETPDVMSKGWGAEYYRICVLTVLKHKETGYVFNVYNLHLDHQVDAARIGGIQLVLERMKQRPEGFHVVMGDFNVPASHTAHVAIATEMTDCQSTVSNADYGCTFNGWTQATEGDTIDFILVDKDGGTPKNFTICRDTWSDAEGEGYLYSDHYAVRSDVSFTMTAKKTVNRLSRQISLLPDPIQLTDGDVVAALRNEITALLTEEEASTIANLSILEAAETTLATWPYGDLDGNGTVGASDALVALQYTVGKVSLNTSQLRVGNVDGNQKVDATDGLEILKMTVGKIQQFPVEEAR